eukprot:TRINITY_DN9395_c0_g1_i1.p1 TRINITY_DN9395_c0_g1~~TRINITY_DN9395_c0_g1_i1.p1  ORF type:complete len:222 (+),score=11.99 TRINITY_DN9395_c0_g1_i1:169-834(+)
MDAWTKLSFLLYNLKSIHWLTVEIGVLSMLIIIILQFIQRRVSSSKSKLKYLRFVPETLVVVIFGICLSRSLNLQVHDVAILGHVSNKLPYPNVPKLTEKSFEKYLRTSVILSVVGFVESLIIAKRFATKYHKISSSNRELVALGIANVVSSFFQSYPTFGCLSRSSMVDKMGAKTPLHGVVTVVIVIITILFLGREFEHLPVVVMSSIIILAGLSDFSDV